MGYIFKSRLLGFPFSRTILGQTKGTQTDAVVMILFAFRLFAQLSDCEFREKKGNRCFVLFNFIHVSKKHSQKISQLQKAENRSKASGFVLEDAAARIL